ADGRRSTTALGREVVAAALAGVDPAGSRAAGHEMDWRRGYLRHFRKLLEAGLTSPEAARRIAADGLAALHQRMRVRSAAGEEVRLADALSGPGAWPAGEPLRGVTLAGGGTPERELSLPYRGQRLRGDALARQLDTWVAAGTVEPTCAEAVRAVAANPDWLDLSGLRVVVLGAGAEMGPVPALLRWGGEVVAVDLPVPRIWQRLAELARRYAGRLHVPVRGGGDLAERAGVDLAAELPALAAWLEDLETRLVLGNYAYADGAAHVRVAVAADLLAAHLLQRRPDTALASLATPTDVYAVPAEAVAHANAAYQRRKALTRPVRWLT